MTRMRRLSALAIGLVAAMGLAACGGGSSSGAQDGNTIKIGFMGDLTGENSGLVIPPRNGARLAIDQYNATNPPKRLELVEYDSQGSADQAVPQVQTAVQEDGIVALIGPAFSGESRAAVPILEQARIPSVSPSATAANLSTNNWRYWHRVVANDDFQGPAIADFLVRNATPTKAFVVSDDQEYSVGIAEAVVKKMQGSGVQVETDRFAQQASDYASTVAKIQAAQPQVIFYGGYYAQAGRLLKQIRDAGITATFASGDGSTDRGIVDGAGQPAAEGAVLGCPCAIPGASATQGSLRDFYTKYTAAYQAEPAIYAAEGYDAATALINVIKGGAADSEAINNGLKTVSFQGVAKPIRFQPTGDVQGTDIFVHVVKGGKIELLGNAEQARLG